MSLCANADTHGEKLLRARKLLFLAPLRCQQRSPRSFPLRLLQLLPPFRRTLSKAIRGTRTLDFNLFCLTDRISL